MVDVFGSDFLVIYHGPILELFLLYIGEIVKEKGLYRGLFLLLL